jgi:tetratricopeptide (TPR) repeat protein
MIKNRRFQVVGVGLRVFALVLAVTVAMHTNASAQGKKDKKDKKASARKERTKDYKAISEEDSLKVQYLFFDGLKEKTLGNHDAAQAFFRKALSIDPGNDGIMYELGQTYVVMSKFDEALVLFKEAARLDPKNEWYLISVASILEQKKQYKEAAGVIERLISLNPEKVDYYFDYASMLLYDAKLEEAIKTYNTIESKIGVNEDVSIQKEKIWLKLGKTDKAIAEIQALIQYNPKERRFRMMLGEIYLANNMEDKAFQVYQDVLKQFPGDPFAHLALADYYRSKGKEEESFGELKAAFSSNDLDIDHKVRIVSAYFALLSDEKMRKKALTLTTIMTETHPEEAKAFAIHGDFLYQDRQLKEARAAYEKTIQLDKNVFAVWQNLMFIDAELSDYKALLQSSEDALVLFPNQVILYYFNGVAKFQLKDYNGAITSYKNGLSLNPDNQDLEAQLNAGLGDAYHSLDRHKESDASYDAALALRPDEPFVLNNYAYYLSLRNEQMEKAEKMSKRSNELVPNTSSFEDTYAWILYKLGRYEEARTWIEKAMQNGGSGSSTIVEHYGDILFRLGQKDLAVANWQKAKEFGEGSSLLNRKISEQKLIE